MSADPEKAEEQMLSLFTAKYSHWRYENEWRSLLSFDGLDFVLN